VRIICANIPLRALGEVTNWGRDAEPSGAEKAIRHACWTTGDITLVVCVQQRVPLQ